MVRLQKYLAECGVASRRASERLIEAGRVTVNGAPAEVGASVDPQADTVCVDDQQVAAGDPVYIVLNKPEGAVTTASDTHGRRTVLDCVAGVKARVYPVGRLDMDVSGVLLLTNDGAMAHRLMHPSFQVSKVYLAWVTGRVDEEALHRLRRGVELEDGERTAPAQAHIVKQGPRNTELRLVLHEGKKREVKRMCAAVGHDVQRLRRISFAGIRAHNLRPGEWRYLTSSEIQHLMEITQHG